MNERFLVSRRLREGLYAGISRTTRDGYSCKPRHVRSAYGQADAYKSRAGFTKLPLRFVRAEMQDFGTIERFSLFFSESL